MARPKTLKEGKRRNIYVADADYKALQLAGGGNASEGIRELLKCKNSKRCTK